MKPLTRALLASLAALFVCALIDDLASSHGDDARQVRALHYSKR